MKGAGIITILLYLMNNTHKKVVANQGSERRRVKLEAGVKGGKIPSKSLFHFLPRKESSGNNPH